METASANVEPERLRYLTQGLLDLRSGGGLTWAALGLLLFAMEVEDVLPHRYIGFFLWVVGGLSWYLAVKYIPKYYERRFGHVEPPKSSMNPREAVTFLIIVTLFLLFIVYLFIAPFIGLATGRSLDILFGRLGDQAHVLIHDPAHLVRWGPILYFAFLLICGFQWTGKNKDRAFLLIMSLESLFWIAFFLYPLSNPAVCQVLLWRIAVVFLLPKRAQNKSNYE